ncbi:metallophosphoesterase family protein [Halosegnis marinus]|uniref:Phosphoesterase n=1 Tax=Halosegnis marinus TaxID=3034023 RepID=A0ABD5ZML9_9EURY|nr:metallophosphoesterase family protein [Halosegnis sp. DT85]
MRLLLMGDTHVPSREAAIPEWVLDETAAADRVIHTGDFDSPAALDTVREHAPELTAVLGNIDPADLGVPEVATLDVGGVRFVVTHGTGDIAGYDDRVARVTDEHAADDRLTVGVSGHTHQRRDEEHGGYRLLNPGSATGADPAPDASVMVAEVADGEVSVETLVR